MAKSKKPERNCAQCAKKIPTARIEALPDTEYCVKCVADNPEPCRHDPNVVCAVASPSGQNGWSARS